MGCTKWYCRHAPARGGGYQEIHEFCGPLALQPRHAVRDGGEWFNVYCFVDPADAEKFRQRFGGEMFSPDQRGKGSNWARWNKA